jgi:hypothetical protein
MKPMRDISTIKDGDRLFYELGYKRNSNIFTYDSNWVRTGEFIEVENVKHMVENDNYINDIEYLEHHNFMVIKL